jgi:hypothetical protein
LALLACDRPAPKRLPAQAAQAQADSYQATISRDSLTHVRWNLPYLASAVLQRPGVLERYSVFLGLNPYYQRGLFDQDTFPDVAVQITENSSGKRGVAIIHGRDSTLHVLGVNADQDYTLSPTKIAHFGQPAPG